MTSSGNLTVYILVSLFLNTEINSVYNERFITSGEVYNAVKRTLKLLTLKHILTLKHLQLIEIKEYKIKSREIL